jgi:CRISPR/Cas system-associated exonuclease Cas4 (RecB family)
MKPALVLTRAMLETFVICQRRFQLRYLESVPWPITSHKPAPEEARRLGEKFHQMLHRHFLGLQKPVTADLEPELARWWRAFLGWEPSLPAGGRLPEFTLTVPVGSHFISGRMDLVVITNDSIHIYDWKTGMRVSPKEQLWTDMQTRLYLTLAVEGAEAIGSSVDPDEVSLTYWYSTKRPTAVTLDYDDERHRQFWQGFREVVDQIDSMLSVSGKWTLTEDLLHCRRCAYQIICEREAGSPELDKWEFNEPESEIEPEWP